MLKSLGRIAVVIVVLALVTGTAVAYSIVSGGLSTRRSPSKTEEAIALTFRKLATPSADRSRVNPVTPTEATIDGALDHFADHCASCHANDGSGNTSMGRSFYPPAPDMRATRTQSLSDGELFSIIENGIRLTGMPAWGTGTEEGEKESWALVHFIRRLPKVSADQIARMESLNPQSPAKLQEAEEARRFLEGTAGSATPPQPTKPHHE